MNKKLIKPFVILIVVSVIIALVFIALFFSQPNLPKYSLKNQTISFKTSLNFDSTNNDKVKK